MQIHRMPTELMQFAQRQLDAGPLDRGHLTRVLDSVAKVQQSAHEVEA
jgi:hypothetical protein